MKGFHEGHVLLVEESFPFHLLLGTGEFNLLDEKGDPVVVWLRPAFSTRHTPSHQLNLYYDRAVHHQNNTFLLFIQAWGRKGAVQ